MSTSHVTRNRIAAGTPAGGQFATQARSEPAVRLSTGLADPAATGLGEEERMGRAGTKAAVGIFAASLALAACSQPGTDPAPTTTPPAPSEPSPTSTPTAGEVTTPVIDVESLAPGDEIPEGAEVPAGKKAYELPGGKRVLVDPKAELPEAVRKDVDGRADKDAVPIPKNDPANGGVGSKAAREFATKVGAETGKYVAVLYRRPGTPPGKPTGVYWLSTVGGNGKLSLTEADARKVAEKYIKGAIGGPESWIIVVMDAG